MCYMKEVLKKNRNWVIVYLVIGLFNAFMSNYKAGYFQRVVDGLADRTITVYRDFVLWFPSFVKLRDELFG